MCAGLWYLLSLALCQDVSIRSADERNAMTKYQGAAVSSGVRCGRGDCADLLTRRKGGNCAASLMTWLPDVWRQ